jgi:molybdate transport system substrate-binding protein
MKRGFLHGLAIGVFAVTAPLTALAGDLSVAVAANFTAPMKHIAQDFERDSGYKLRLAFAATGQFYAQIRNGAPFEILLSADDTTPLRLEQEGLAVAGSRFTYATGRLALWSRTPGLVDDQGEVLRRGQFARIAIASPKLAPYGVAAISVLEKMGLRDRIAPKIVEGSNISQTFQFIATDNAQLGFVAVSQVFEKGRLKEGSAWVVPASMHPPIRQDAVLLRGGERNAAASALLQYLKGERARAVIRSFGYEA